MYEQLTAFFRKPTPFSVSTIARLWTDPHIAHRMLALHLDDNHEIASRSSASITAILDWIESHCSLSDLRVADLGCGPGLYAREMAVRGARVTGLDISQVSLAHARGEAIREGMDITYLQADYLSPFGENDFDLVTLIYGDICALSPPARQTVFANVRRALRPGGVFMLDAFAKPLFETRQPASVIEYNYMGGFWAETDYFALHNTHLYPDQMLSLDHYLILQPGRQFEVYNWLEHFTPEKLETELATAGFTVLQHAPAPRQNAAGPNSEAFIVMAQAEPAGRARVKR